MTDEEILATVCGYFCDEGLTAVKIQARLEQDHSVFITREKPYEYLRRAAARGWIRFVPPQEHSLEQHVRSAYPWLHDAIVVKTARIEDVAYRGAKMLLELLQQHYLDEEVHIGFSGGYALRTLAQRFGELLREPAGNLPREIVFHALVAGFDVEDPTTDPNAFFSYFVKDPAMPVETRFVALHAPAILEADLLPRLRLQAGIAEAYDRAREINIVVTSTSCWNDEHSMLRHYMKVAKESAHKLTEAGCVGDMLWQPIGIDGPMEMNTVVRAVTIKELRDLSGFVAEGNYVLLLAGPCARCHTPKTEVVKAILDQDQRLVTHLVVDSLCARGLTSS